MVKRISCQRNTQQVAVLGDVSYFFLGSLTTELGTSIHAGVQLTFFKQHGSGMFRDKIHLPPEMKRNGSALKKENVQYDTKTYCPWEVFDYCVIDKNF